MKKLLTILAFLPVVLQAQTVKYYVPGEYWNGIVGSDNKLYAYDNGSSTPVVLTLPSSQTVAGAAVGFNDFKVVTNTGNYYSSVYYNIQPFVWTQTTTDTLGGTLNDCIAVYAWASGVCIERADSSLWLHEADTMGIFHAMPGAYFITKPIKLSQTGVKYKKVVMCGNGIYGLTNDGKVYFWQRNSQTITPSLIWSGSPQPVIDISSNTFDAVLAIVRNATGDPTCGHVYAKGNSWGDWGGTSVTYSSFTDISSILQMPYSVKKVLMSENSLHFIDSVGDLYGVAKCNSQGELGNGVEYVNRYTYSNFPGIGWTFNSTENPVAGPAVKIHAGIKHMDMYASDFFGFYYMVTDSSNNSYFWGRNKTNIGFMGVGQNANDNANHPNALDESSPVLSPNPLTQSVKTLDFTGPTLAVSGGNQTISTSTTTVTAVGNPIVLVNHSNSTDTVRGATSERTYLWTRTSGSGVLTIPTAKSSPITGLANGVSVFDVIMTDAHQGTTHATVQITTTITGTPTNMHIKCRGCKTKYF